MDISATVIADSVGKDSPRLLTMELRYPFYVHHNVMAHRQFSRNVGVGQMFPTRHQEFSVCLLVTATESEWERFVDIRSNDKQIIPLQALSDCVGNNLSKSTARARALDEWHLPYIDDQTFDDIMALSLKRQIGSVVDLDQLTADVERTACRVSVARCAYRPANPIYGCRPLDAAIGYVEHIRSQITVTDVLLHGPGGMKGAYFEHQAQPDYMTEFRKSSDWSHPYLHGNLKGWQQYRKMFVGEESPARKRQQHQQKGMREHGESNTCL